MEFRRIFDTIPDQFDRYRTRYSKELFAYLIEHSKIDFRKNVLELGPGTGQATDPVLETGCAYYGIELGDNFARMLNVKYGDRRNFHLIHDDFITHDFRGREFDLIYSAATIQWIPEEIAFVKTFDLLNPGGMLAMFQTRGDYETPNPALFRRIQQVYAEYFKPVTCYTHGSFKYENAMNYGYVDFQRHEFLGARIYDADTYVAYCGTHCDHIVIPEPDRSRFFSELRKAVMDFGNRVEFRDTHILMTVKKPGY